jgi:hypothetical protein
VDGAPVGGAKPKGDAKGSENRGITIAGMIPSELNRICRSAKAMGPFGSRTPSEQPPSVAALIKTKAGAMYRILSLVGAGDERTACVDPSAIGATCGEPK